MKENILKKIINNFLNYQILKENFYLLNDEKFENPVTKDIINSISYNLPITKNAKKNPEVEASGAEGIVISLDDYKVIKLFFSKENAAKNSMLYSKNFDFTAKIYSAGRIDLDVPVRYFRKGSNYSATDDAQKTKNIYYVIMQRIVPDEKTYNDVELAYENFFRISKIKIEHLEMMNNLNDSGLSLTIDNIINKFLIESNNFKNSLDEKTFDQLLNSSNKLRDIMSSKKTRNIFNVEYSVWRKTQTKNFLFYDKTGRPLLLKHFLLNDIEAKNVIPANFNIDLVKDMMFASKEFQKSGADKKYEEIANLLEKIIIENKIPWKDIHRGQFGRDDKGNLIAVDIGLKSDSNTDSVFNKNVSKLSLRGKEMKLVENLDPDKIQGYTINFFDFDKTLFDTPGPEEGKITWENLYGTKFPHIGWLSKAESLDHNLDIPANREVMKFYHNNQGSQSLNVILSDRIPKMQLHMESLLNLYGIHPDLFLLNTGPHKSQRLRSFVESFAHPIAEINLFDDKESVLQSYLEFKNLYDLWESGIKISIYKIQNGIPVIFDSKR